MHEYGLVRTLLRQVDEIARQQGVREVQRVSVTIGPLSGVEPLLVSAAFDELADSFDLGQPELEIRETGLNACCRDCGLRFEVQRFVFECPSCRSRAVQVVGGDEFRLDDLVVYEP